VSQEITTTPVSTPLAEPTLTPELIQTVDSHDKVRYVGTHHKFEWTEIDWNGKPRVQSVDIVPNKVYTLMSKPRKTDDLWNFWFMAKYFSVEEKNLCYWTLVETRHDEIVLQEKRKRSWTMASKSFPKIRSQFKEATTCARARIKWDLKDLEIQKKMELLTKLTPSELGLLEFLETSSGNPEEDVKRLFEIYHLFTSQQND
jgi:hypothetical protein